MAEPAQDETLSALVAGVVPFAPEVPARRVYDAFNNDPALYAVAVVDADGRPIGLLNRFKFLEALSKPFAHELFRHRTVAMVMDPAPLIVDEHVPLDGRYLGIGTGYSLMRLLTKRAAARRALRRRRSLQGGE